MKAKLFSYLAVLVLCLMAQPAFASCTLPAGAMCETGPCGGETRPAGHVLYNSDHEVNQVCMEDGGWFALGPIKPDPCADNPTPGTVCNNGSVYAGLSPDGNVPMYTTPADAGLFAWNDANFTGYTTTSQTSNVTGQANTAALIGLDSNSAVGGMQPHRAAQHCADLVAHGQSDWYLPARDELNVLWVNRAAIGGFNLSGSMPAGWYWSSSEDNNVSARFQRFSDGNQNILSKTNGLSVRCVRR